ncbi:MAG: pyridoxamine 5'-phosphate oxidase family protein [Saprospiraceae bacterium]
MGDVKHYSRSQEAIKKIKDMTNDINICMMCTNLNNMPISTCPMATQEVDEEGNIWFLSTKNSNHNQDIEQDSRSQLIYAHPGQASFLSLYGSAEVLYDRQLIEDIWKPDAKIWFQEGKDDPNLTVIRFSPEEGYYWDTKSSKMVAFLKMATSLVTGKTMDDGIEGKLKV